MPVLCAHGGTVFYYTARVKLQSGSWEHESRVVAAPNLDDVLLGQDIYDYQNFEKALVIMTGSMQWHGAPQLTVTSNAHPLPQLLQDQPSSDGVELKRKEDKSLAGVVKTDWCPEDKIGQEGQAYQESGGLQATPEQLRLWQQQEPSLKTVRCRVSVGVDERVCST